MAPGQKTQKSQKIHESHKSHKSGPCGRVEEGLRRLLASLYAPGRLGGSWESLDKNGFCGGPAQLGSLYQAKTQKKVKKSHKSQKKWAAGGPRRAGEAPGTCGRPQEGLGRLLGPRFPLPGRKLKKVKKVIKHKSHKNQKSHKSNKNHKSHKSGPCGRCTKTWGGSWEGLASLYQVENSKKFS